MPSSTQKILGLALVATVALGAAAAVEACTSLDGLTGDAPQAEGGGGETSTAAGLDFGKPCIRNDDCASGVCIPIGSDDAGAIRSACTKTCEKNPDCLAGWSCAPTGGRADSVCQCNAASEQCDGKDNDCNGSVDDQAAEACKKANGGSGWACASAACACAGKVCPATDAGAAGCVDLTADPLHCGTCDQVCPKGGSCTASKCRCAGDAGACPSEPGGTFACGDDGACREQFDLATGGIVYFAGTDTDVLYSIILDGTVYRVPKGGGTPAVVTTVSSVIGMAVGGTSLGLVTPTSVRGCLLPSCSNPFDVPDGAIAIAAANGQVYWVRGSNGAIEAHATDNTGTTTELFPGIGAGVSETSITADASGVYVAYPNGSIYLVALGGGATLLASGQPAPKGIAVTTDRFFVATDAGVLTCTKVACGGSPVFLVTGAVANVTADASRVYWSTNKGIFGCTPGNCVPTRLLDRPISGAIRESGDSIYFSYSGGVGRVTK